MPKRKKYPPIIARVIKAVPIPQLADALKIDRHAIYQWKRVPVERVLLVESLTQIPRHELRPDIYPREDAA